MSDPDFLYRNRFGKRVFRLGLSDSYGLDEAGIRKALDGPMNYVFWLPLSGKMTRALKDAVKRDRERYVIATGPTFGYFAGSIRRAAENALRKLSIDYVDVFKLFWLGKGAAFSERNVEELLKLKAEGKVRALGVSVHDRPRAGRLAEDSPLDVLMIRYNAAHPGAEREIFPHLEKRKPAIVAYTATSWTKLLRKPRKWTGRVPSAGDCYRFCLTSPHVDVVLTAPGKLERLEANLKALEQGPLSAEEMAWMREYGQVVHG